MYKYSINRGDNQWVERVWCWSGARSLADETVHVKRTISALHAGKNDDNSLFMKYANYYKRKQTIWSTILSSSRQSKTPHFLQFCLIPTSHNRLFWQNLPLGTWPPLSGDRLGNGAVRLPIVSSDLPIGKQYLLSVDNFFFHSVVSFLWGRKWYPNSIYFTILLYLS